ncbi:hypothetical protein D9757_004825 [Collybiopsis confluens]|uniref:acireductone dioxygenase (Fe(2+)-requiring) n=1 Tax=Collybiopsis confluens TaxID=2823264 RepID=A0A8H5HSK5_9AGAR|nr:hypothetical protein D9757_004825 [Collybiopsis confluens]
MGRAQAAERQREREKDWLTWVTDSLLIARRERPETGLFFGARGIKSEQEVSPTTKSFDPRLSKEMTKSYSHYPRDDRESDGSVMSLPDDESLLGDKDKLSILGFQIRKLVYPAKDYKYQMQLIARTLSYPEQPGQQIKDGDSGKEITHTHECMYYVVSGTCFFDIRDEGEKWARIQLEAGDVMTVPAGSYYRWSGECVRYTEDTAAG